MSQTTSVIISSFQPLYECERLLILEAIKHTNEIVIVLDASFSARSVRNPFTANERKDLIRANLAKDLAGHYSERLRFVEARDSFYDRVWSEDVTEQVESHSANKIELWTLENDPVANRFPEWTVRSLKTEREFNVQTARERFLRDPNLVDVETCFSAETKAWLTRFAASVPAYHSLHEEQLAMDKYRSAWASSPYPPIFVTTDAVVLQAGHVLLIERGDHPGKGLLALPGGFLEHDERIEACAIRELIEETAFAMEPEELRKHLFAVKVFDHPKRSARGRTIAHAHGFRLPGQHLTTVKASDDAAKVHWIPMDPLNKLESKFFEDHFYILQSLLREL